MAHNFAEKPTAMARRHEMGGIWEDAEDSHKEIGHGQIEKEKIGDSLHRPLP
jgi:hypothetical protein